MDIQWDVFMKGLEVAGLGLAGVFSVLILFFVITKIMVAMGNKLEKNDTTQS